MIHPLKSLREIIVGKPAEVPVKIKLLSACRLAKPNGTPIDGLEGETYEVSRPDALSLENSGRAEILGGLEFREAQLRQLQELLPPPEEPAPVPSGWEELPDCFTRWWHLTEKIDPLRRRYEKIMEKMLKTTSMINGGTGLSGIQMLDKSCITPGQRLDWLSDYFGDIARSTSSNEHEVNLTEAGFLLNALHELERAIADALDAHHDDITIEFHKCSDFVVESHSALRRASDSTKCAALKIFSLRVAALGLGPAKTYDLFFGSSDWQKYDAGASIPELSCMRSAWFLLNGADQRTYMDRPVPTLAALLQSWRFQLPAARALLAAAEAELAAALAAQAPTPARALSPRNAQNK